MRVFFTGSDPVDAVEDLTYDCAIGPASYDGEGEDEGDDDEYADDPEDEGADDGDWGEERKGEAPWEIDCTSPWTAKGLDPGRHVVEVIAFDEELNEDATPATASFKVKKGK